MIAKPPTSISWFQKLQHGQRYMKTWPTDKRLATVFPEHRVIRVTLFAIRAMPPISVFILTWQIAFGGELGPAIATALFACSMPLQGLWWLGNRAITPLPPSLLIWFHEVRNKLQDKGLTLSPVEEPTTYQALANVLKRAFKQLDDTFLDDV